MLGLPIAPQDKILRTMDRFRGLLGGAAVGRVGVRAGDAGAKRAEAGEVIREIGGLLKDENLRQAYLKSMAKVTA